MSIEQSIQTIIEELYDSKFASENVDLNIEDVGNLNYCLGKKLRLRYVDLFENDDVQEWEQIAQGNGAHLSYGVNTSTGHIDLNLEFEYIKTKAPHSVTTTWLIKLSMTIATVVWSYQQLNQTNPSKYGLPPW
jgi:hypothetical protein|tara:strand:+ start:537 stop:935 length:399 start_codon:yes stop_codon:yes gene_type:complete